MISYNIMIISANKHYRNFLENYGKVARCLHKLLSKDVAFEMTAERVEAWKKNQGYVDHSTHSISP